MRHKHETVRLMVDFPIEQHTYIKMMNEIITDYENELRSLCKM